MLCTRDRHCKAASWLSTAANCVIFIAALCFCMCDYILYLRIYEYVCVCKTHFLHHTSPDPSVRVGEG